MGKVYYYKTVGDVWHFSTGVSRDARRGNDYLRMLRYSGREVEKLYLDLPEDFEIIKSTFYSPEYWKGRTWEEEYNRE